MNWLALSEDFTFVWLVNTRDDLYQSRRSSAILSQQGMNFTGTQSKRHFVQHLDP
jgi:hypothetical protein